MSMIAVEIHASYPNELPSGNLSSSGAWEWLQVQYEEIDRKFRIVDGRVTPATIATDR